MKFTPIRLTRVIGASLLIALTGTLSMGGHAQTIDLGTQSAPDTFVYQDSLQTPNQEFVDWFAFAVGDSYYNSITATLSLAKTFGIDHLNTSLYSGTLVNNQPVIGNLIAMGSNTQFVIGNSVQTTSIVPHTYLHGGNYLIKVSGMVTGSFGGSYTGIGNVAPVPLPSSLSLLALSLGLIAFYRKRLIK